MKFNILNMIKGSLGSNNRQFHLRDPEPKSHYDVIIIGGGGHGLAAAYYLAKHHGMTNVAVLEKGDFGSGYVGDNRTIVQANYHLDGNSEFYSHSMKLWQNAKKELNCNVMLKKCGVLNLCYCEEQFDFFARRGNAIIAQGDEAVLMNREMVREQVPQLNFDDARFPIYGGLWQKNAGTASHEALAMGYAFEADQRGVDLIQNCEVTGMIIENGQIKGVDTTRGKIMAGKVGISVAGEAARLRQMAGMNLPIASHMSQIYQTEALKPILDCVVTFGMGPSYINQSDNGGIVLGSGLDFHDLNISGTGLSTLENIAEMGMAMFPAIGRANVQRSWGEIVDLTMDGSPIIDKTHIGGLYLNGGWGHHGFNAMPASGSCFAHLLATERPSEFATKLRLDRFERGYILDEEGKGVPSYRF